ncbi:unnamed protein product [Hymenolepis diminuta]|uniref:Scm-like with four mbt domains 2 n=1 Tax=Hymenolepis diminuta TaxID=6216 RepID=A0A0R3SSA5_HYMDI|nr:unnamed protein product [Hymenolepis diminuta]
MVYLFATTHLARSSLRDVVGKPGYGGIPVGNGHPMQAGMMPGGMMPQMPNGMMAQYGAPMPNMMQAQQMQPTIYPYQTGMMSWPYQPTHLGHPPQMQPATPATPVFQFQISPGKNVLGRK